MLSPSQIADKWSRNLGAATQAIGQGVDAVTVSPTEKAARQVEAYAAGIQRAIADGKYTAGLRRVSLEDWKRSMKEKGIQRIASGASAAKPKFEAFMGTFMPHLESGMRMLESMPRGSFEQNMARAMAMAEHNRKYRRS